MTPAGDGRSNCLKIVLFALTGMGNDVLEALLDSTAVESVVVVTRSERGKFPYYDCQHLENLCLERKIKTYVDISLKCEDDIETLRRETCDLCLVATFNQLIPESCFSRCQFGAFNFHPSLLPRYRGPMPTNWAIIHGETMAGITVHRLTPELDNGEIVLTKALPVNDRTDGQLRRALAREAGSLAKKLIESIRRGVLHGVAQDESAATTFPRIQSEAGRLLLASGNFDPNNLRRGLTPFPGPDFQNGGHHEL